MSAAPAVPRAPTEPPRKDGLDVLRALAILAVLGFHAPEPARTGMPEAVRAVFASGWMGVDLFFVLSGYLIGRQVFGPQEDVGLGARLRTFWTKRWMRTLPLYFVVLAAYALKPWVLGVPFPGDWRFLFFLQNYAAPRDFVQSWSLCVEEHFYLLLPLLAFGLGGTRWPAVAWLVPVGLSLGARVWTWSHLPEGFLVPELSTLLQWPTHLHLDGLAVGVFLAKTAPTWRAWPRAWRAACGGLGVAVLALTFVVCGVRLSATEGVSLGLYTGLAVGFGLLMVGLESARLPAVLRGPVYQVAVLSYGAYLWHGLVVRVMERAHVSVGVAPLDFVIFVVATLASAWVTYSAVEKPFLRLRDRVLARRAAHDGARGSATVLGG